jgi:transposase
MQITGKKSKRNWRYRHEKSFIQVVVREYLQSGQSLKQVAKKFGVPCTSVWEWTKRFSSELTAETSSPMTPEEQQQLEALKKQNEELKKKLDLANLKITGLEMMIDIAEEELKLDIRKKPGTKQSED